MVAAHAVAAKRAAERTEKARIVISGGREEEVGRRRRGKEGLGE